MNKDIITSDGSTHRAFTAGANRAVCTNSASWDVSADYKTPKYRAGEVVTFSCEVYTRTLFYMGNIVGAEFVNGCWMYLITKGDNCLLSVPEHNIKEVIYINYQEVTNPPSDT